ncbi:MAG: hypothetical protein AAGA60_32455 [Cyanobacteria bacterium P01_E01_bin.42]
MTAKEIADEIPHLNLAQVHAALAYFYLNKERIEADILAEENEYNRPAAEAKI